ncbi:MAG: tyrosine-type recombinase/integrase [Planctomycetota bacterium]
MKLAKKEKVPGTSVIIGHRVVGTLEYSTWNAEYTDIDGRRVYPSLKTRNRQAAIRKALEIQARLDEGRPEQRFVRIRISELTSDFLDFSRSKDLAPRSIAKYEAEIDKLNRFCTAKRISYADQFTEREFYKYREWLCDQRHKQGTSYAGKSLYTTLTVCKQVFKWAWRQKLLPVYELAAAELPKSKAKPQPCPTTDQIHAIIGELNGIYADAVTILAFTGMRVGELVQQQWEDVLLDRGELGVLHIQRGGSAGTTKDKDDRFVPIHPLARQVYDRLYRKTEIVLPGLRDRTLLAQLKRAAAASGYPGNIKTHSLRHHFASVVANSGVPYRMAMAWMGHSSSSILDLYYHLHDGESEAAMKQLGGTTGGSMREVQL